jgi:hypothetical protein
MDLDSDLDSDLDPDLDLDSDLYSYLLHPQPQHSLRVVHAFMRGHTIEHVCDERVPMEGDVLRQEQLIWCIKRQQQQQHALSRVRFKLRAMFLYNMDLAADELLDFVRCPKDEFITPISAVEDVAVHPTIPMFAGLNALHIMYEAAADNQPNQPNQPNQHNQTKKRVVIQQKKQKHKHTRGRQM